MSTIQPLPPDAAAFYAAQSAFSAPGRYVGLYDDLPVDPRALAEVARGLMIHRLEGETFAYGIPAERLHDDAETRYLDDILGLIVERDGGASLTRPRVPGDRFVGVCRDFALLLCSFLRHRGIPARLRSGFADYFGTDGLRVDHMVTEYWDDRYGWRLADPELADERVIRAHSIEFDPMDVPRDRFLVAGRALRLIHEGEADPESFGIALPDRLLAGEWFVVGNVRLDLAALNKAETLLWDVWGAGADSDEALTDDVRDLYARVARVTAAEVDFAAARTMFNENDDLRTPGEVLCLAPYNGPSHVTLR